MKRYGWVTDIHLNFLLPPGCHAFLELINSLRLDGLLVSGDIAEGHTLETYLGALDEYLNCEIYFVLGNHDFYYSSIDRVRQMVRRVCRNAMRLHWLSSGLVVPLSDTTGLIGHDGWADGRVGNFFGSSVIMSDYLLIDELANIDSQTRFAKLKALGDEVADYLRELLPKALAQFDKVILLTHVPPFSEACRHSGEPSDLEFLPHFTCKVVGDLLRDVMKGHTDKQLTVLCGHAHRGGEAQIASNLMVKTGKATYGAPAIQEIITV